MRMSEPLPELIRRWQAGWGLARGLPPAEESGGALHVRFGLPRRRMESIVLDLDALPALAAGVFAADRPDWLTVITTDLGAAVEAVEAAGLRVMDDSESFMGIALDAHPVRVAAPPYKLVVSTDGPVSRAEVWAGELAAYGTVAVAGRDAVAHDIATVPEHRRRGLAAVVMSALAAQAAGRGAKTGLLVASEEGRHLYTALGWEPIAAMLVAFKP
ncbi:GNAT family N-acetyltransferase [Nonomuraea sp. NPDC050556]|uniref:GNAT family N-acetyltransferase n=1 Tax=Nonomuraea sp. NPDC050556 TaxID=3364369 RepID=UPI003792713D